MRRGMIFLAALLTALVVVHPADADRVPFGITQECWNCTPFTAKVKLSHYEPMRGDVNCWQFEDGYCKSYTFSGVPWESAWGFGAACPVEYPIGTWVMVEGVGSFVCLDRGGSVVCDKETGICNVDILGPGGWWDQGIFEVTLWVPRSVLLRRQ